jgi:NADH-quinone oxidoreductase subunit M
MHRPRSSSSPSLIHPARVFLLALAFLSLGTAAHAADTDAPPSLELQPRSLVFGAPGIAVITVSNRGNGSVTLNEARVVSQGAGDFTAEPIRHRELAPGASSTVKVTFQPSSRVRRQSFAAVEIDYAAAGAPDSHVQTVPLRGGEDLSLLTWLIFAPLLGIPLLLFWPGGRERQLRVVALVVTAVPLALAARMVAMFDPLFKRAEGNFGYQFVQHLAWIRAFNVEYHVGVDGLSVGLVALTALIGFIAVLASWSIPPERNLRGYFSLLMVLETGLLGVFCALDLFLFYVFWELVLVPMFFLIGLWGGPRKEYAAIKFFLYTLLGSVLILLAIIALYYASAPTMLVDGTPAAHTLDIPKLVHLNDFGKHPALLGFRFVNLLWVLLFIGFAIKVPVVPLHTWLPDAHVEAPTAVSVILASVMLKMGTYGMLRIGWSILPEATRWAAPAVSTLGAICIVYGAFCALAQTDLKRLVAYSSISHLGFCLLGMAALTPLGVNGAIFQMLSHGVVSGLLFLLVGVLYDRAKTRGLDDFGGVATVMPRYATVFALAFLASLGLPGLSGFIGELLALVGSFGHHRIAASVSAFGLVIGAAYNLWAIRRIHLGPLPDRWKAVLTGRDLDWREWASLLPLVALTIGLGLYPAPIIDAASTSVAELLAMMGLPSAGLGGEL